MKKVLIAQPIAQEAMELLENQVEVIVSSDPADEVVREHIKGCHGLIVRTATKLSSNTIMAADMLQVISRTGAGTDNVDIEAATSQGILVCNTPEANTTTVAEHTFSLILGLVKNINFLDRETKKGNWSVRDGNHTFDLAGKAIGIIGFGKIGQEVARLAEAFRMSVVVYDPFFRKGKEDFHVEFEQDLCELLKMSDIVSLHVPLTDSTKGMIGDEEFQNMKKNCLLINTSRGGQIMEKELLNALKGGIIAGVGLDVFEHEPLRKDNPLCSMERVILTPHIAALTQECKVRVAKTAAVSVLEVLGGGIPTWVVNKEVLEVI